MSGAATGARKPQPLAESLPRTQNYGGLRGKSEAALSSFYRLGIGLRDAP